jgi:hypothetical protein
MEVFGRAAEILLRREVVVSTTRVSPSQWPIESPIHGRMRFGKCVPPMRTTRASWTISSGSSRDRASARSAGCCCRSNSARAASSGRRQQTALGERAILGMVVLAAAHRQLGARLPGASALLRQRWNAAVGRIDDERAAALAVDDRDALTRIEPEIVVAADIARGAVDPSPPLWRRGPVRIARLVETIAAIDDGLLHPRRRFLVNTSSLTFCGRSSGVIVALVQTPWRSGLPSAVRKAAGFAVVFGACAASDVAATDAIANPTSIFFMPSTLERLEPCTTEPTRY